jgi:hypothetical protein
MTYSMTDSLSYITLRGTCFNPGFERSAIYFKAFDAQGEWVASDGLPYATNEIYYSGTEALQPSNITCSPNGLWSTVIEVPTVILKYLNRGNLELSMVVWYKGKELHNDGTSVANMALNVPISEEDTSSMTQQ